MPSVSFDESTQSFSNRSFSFSSPSLHYSDGWARTSISSPSQLNSTVFASSSHVADSITFFLPENATDLYYFGLKQARGGTYNACIDCSDSNDSSSELIDAHDSQASTFVEPLYQITNLDPSISHTLGLVNLPDSRFDNTGTITIHSFVVTVANEPKQGALVLSPSTDTSQSSFDPQTLTPTSSISFSSSADLPSPSSATTTFSLASASASINSNLTEGEAVEKALGPRLMYAGIIAASVLVFSTILFALMYFMRRRKRKRTAPYQADPAHWAARFFGEKGTRKSIFGLQSSAPDSELGRMKSFATSEKEYQRNLTRGTSKNASEHVRHYRSLTEENLLPQNPTTAYHREKPSTISPLEDRLDLSPPSKPPIYSPALVSSNSRKSAGGLSTILCQQLNASYSKHRFSKYEFDSKKDGQMSPTRSPSRKPAIVASHLSRNPPWTYATLSHIHASRTPEVAPLPLQRQPLEPAVVSDGSRNLPFLLDQPHIPLLAPSSGSHVAEAYAKIRERAQGAIGSHMPQLDALDVKDDEMITNASRVSQDIRT